MRTGSESRAPESVGDFVEYGETTAVWVGDGHVFASREDGTTVRMSPEVAIAIGRKLEAAGTESFINNDGRQCYARGVSAQPQVTRFNLVLSPKAESMPKWFVNFCVSCLLRSFA